eukprot:COSAG02_NODE_683_length_18518_cov_4.033172_3_plen_119_part_00
MAATTKTHLELVRALSFELQCLCSGTADVQLRLKLSFVVLQSLDLGLGTLQTLHKLRLLLQKFLDLRAAAATSTSLRANPRCLDLFVTQAQVDQNSHSLTRPTKGRRRRDSELAHIRA